MIEFTSAHDLREHYKRVRARMPPMENNRPKVIPPVIVPELPPPPPKPAAPRVTIVPIRKHFQVALAACDMFALRMDDLRSQSRDATLVLARALVSYICHVHFKVPSSTIGKMLYRDHSSILHSIWTIEARVQDDVWIQAAIEMLTREAQKC